jgi:hypothetical protein
VLARAAVKAGKEPDKRVDELLATVLKGAPAPATFGALALLPEARREALVLLSNPNPGAPGDWPLYDIHRSPKIKDKLFAVPCASGRPKASRTTRALSRRPSPATATRSSRSSWPRPATRRSSSATSRSSRWARSRVEAAIAALVGFVSDRNKALKETSQKLIAELGVEKAGPALEKALASDDKAVRKNAATALGLLPNGPEKTSIAKSAVASEKVKEVKDLLAAIAGSSKKS